MISTLLLVLIYISFISLGLPDSVLGSAWPLMHLDLNVPISFAGILSMTTSVGTIVSAISFSFISKRLRTETITALSTLLTAISLFLFGFLDNFYLFIPVAFTLGLGAGSVDAALNHYVALHYKARQMSFLHASWGIGTTVGPFVLAYLFSHDASWHIGYISVASVQLAIAILIAISSPLWKQNEKIDQIKEETKLGYKEALKKKGAIYALLGFLAYCALEASAILWASAYSVSRGVTAASAATFSGFLFWGITIGRLTSGFITEKLGDKTMIRIGLLFALIALLLLPRIDNAYLGIMFFILGFGFAPTYPSMIHQTPILYGKDASSSLIGLEMATAYIGSSFAPFIFGLISSKTRLAFYPIYLGIFLALAIFATEMKTKGKK